MAATTTQLHDSDKTRPVAVKQTAQEGSAAHPELDGAKNGTEEAMVKQVDVHSTHGGASHDDSDVSVTVMNKRTNQLGTKQYSIKAKLELR